MEVSISQLFRDEAVWWKFLNKFGALQGSKSSFMGVVLVNFNLKSSEYQLLCDNIVM